MGGTRLETEMSGKVVTMRSSSEECDDSDDRKSCSEERAGIVIGFGEGISSHHQCFQIEGKGFKKLGGLRR